MERATDRSAIIRLAQRRARRRIEELLGEGHTADIAALADLLGSDDEHVRFAAIVQLGSLGAMASKALPVLASLSEREKCAENVGVLRWALQAVQARR
jgi:hypothetical protein